MVVVWLWYLLVFLLLKFFSIILMVFFFLMALVIFLLLKKVLLLLKSYWWLKSLCLVFVWGIKCWGYFWEWRFLSLNLVIEGLINFVVWSNRWKLLVRIMVLWWWKVFWLKKWKLFILILMIKWWWGYVIKNCFFFWCSIIWRLVLDFMMLIICLRSLLSWCDNKR